MIGVPDRSQNRKSQGVRRLTGSECRGAALEKELIAHCRSQLIKWPLPARGGVPERAAEDEVGQGKPRGPEASGGCESSGPAYRRHAAPPALSLSDST